MRIELLYFDGCPHWQTASERLRVVAAQLGLVVEHRRIATTAEADEAAFRGSPTILVDGVDPFVAGDEPVGLSCRLYSTPDGPAGAPTVAQLEAALRG